MRLCFCLSIYLHLLSLYILIILRILTLYIYGFFAMVDLHELPLFKQGDSHLPHLMIHYLVELSSERLFQASELSEFSTFSNIALM